MWECSIIWVPLRSLNFSKYVLQRKAVTCSSKSMPPALDEENAVCDPDIGILSWEFLIWPRKRYPRPSHHPFMISSTLKCQVLILATLPLRGISSLMGNTGCHLHPRTRDTGGIISTNLEPPQTTHRGQIKYPIPQPKNQESRGVNVPRENQQLATVAELLTRSLGTQEGG